MTPIERPRALLFGHSPNLMVPMPALLSRAGFDVTLLTDRRELEALRHASRFIRVKRGSLVSSAQAELTNDYALVVATDDQTLRAVRDAEVPLADKLRLLPIASTRGLGHIASKIGLSQALSAGGVTTPEFRAVHARTDLAGAVAALGYPLMLKSDFGMASRNVIRLQTPADLAALRADFPFPAIVQRAIDGIIVDNSGFFRDGEPVNVTSSTVLASTERHHMGLTRARRYLTRAERDSELLVELRQLGHALDADGFVSLGAIRSYADGKLYFYEADMRPTVWVEHPRYFGEDPAVVIARAYGLPPVEQTFAPPSADHVDLAHGPRLTTLDVLLNRYNWRGNFEDYLGRGVLWDRFDKWRVSRWGGRLTAPPLTRFRRLASRLRGRLLAGSSK